MIELGNSSLLPDSPLLRLVIFAGFAVYLASTVLVVVVTWLHFRNRRRERVRVWIKQNFGPLFINCIEGIALPVPRVPIGELSSVMLLWLFYIESTRGQSRARLRELARSIGFPSASLRMLKNRSLADRLVAIATLGRMKELKAWDPLLAIVDSKETSLSLLALRALTQINPCNGIEVMVKRLGARDDWPDARLNALLRELPPKLANPALFAALEQADQAALPRLLRWLEIARPAGAWRVLAPRLQADQSVEVLASALRVADDPRLLPQVRALAEHPEWVVRTKAAIALGRAGEPKDVDLLKQMLSDRVWWVRFRAAQALLKLPFVGRARIEAIAQELNDPFAKDMLTQTLAEHVGNR